MKNIDRLECVYYSAPIPRNPAVLTVLATVFDKIYFPNVYLPKGDYDKRELDIEIDRILAVYNGNPPPDTILLLGVLKFLEHRFILDGICEFTGSKEYQRDDAEADKLVRELYDRIYGPPRADFFPSFDTNHINGLPGGNEEVKYPGSFHYPAGALLFANKHNVPLLNDTASIPVPGTSMEAKGDATILSSLLAIECVRLILPDLPLLRPGDIVEFRSKNSKYLSAFRRQMLLYSQEINKRITSCSDQELAKEVQFFVETEVARSLSELGDALKTPARSWYERADAILYPSIAGAYMSQTGPSLGAALGAIVLPLVSELKAAAERRKVRRSGLYYLLKLQQIESR